MSIDRGFCLACGSIYAQGDARCRRCGEPLAQENRSQDRRVAAVYAAFVLLVALAAFAYIAIREVGVFGP